MDDNRITAYTFTRMQPQATEADFLTAQREMDAYCKENGYHIVGSAFTKEPSEKMASVMDNILTDMKTRMPSCSSSPTSAVWEGTPLQ